MSCTVTAGAHKPTLSKPQKKRNKSEEKKIVPYLAFASTKNKKTKKKRPVTVANKQTLTESAARLMYLRVYDNRVSSHQPAPSPSLCYLLTHAHITLPTTTLLTITYTQVLWFLESLNV